MLAKHPFLPVKNEASDSVAHLGTVLHQCGVLGSTSGGGAGSLRGARRWAIVDTRIRGSVGQKSNFRAEPLRLFKGWFASEGRRVESLFLSARHSLDMPTALRMAPWRAGLFVEIKLP